MTTSLLMSKIIDISAARRRRDQSRKVYSMQNEEKRKEFRRESNESLFVQIVAAPDADLVGHTIACEVRDVSPSGIRIESDVEIPDGSHLDLWIDNASGPGKFFLSSTVRWSASFGGSHQAGVELHEGAATDIDQWRQQYPAL